MLLAVTCPVCETRGRAPCPRCAAELRPAPILPAPPGVDECLTLLSYEGAGRELVARLKYRNHRAALPGLAAAMASLVVDPGAAGVVTWAPTTPQRRRQRGFDQAELLARAVARCLGRPCRRLLVRRPGPPQTGASRAERRHAPVLDPRRGVPHPAVLVVDDVVTTGATMAAAARALRRAGAGHVVALAAARTPGPGLH
ncbi:MAG TPA: phosphoribosyltransferase family protein [Acidimicrobiales bacterium]|nr:phosphoribosyltransferase family protein [Acidimicrobiales bacterium]